jgi:hypothetical protein
MPGQRADLHRGRRDRRGDGRDHRGPGKQQQGRFEPLAAIASGLLQIWSAIQSRDRPAMGENRRRRTIRAGRAKAGSGRMTR